MGRRQAAAAGEALSDVKFDAVLSSDLSRTVETTEHVLKANKYAGPVTKTSQLRERGYGDFEGWDPPKQFQKDGNFHLNAGRSVYDLVPIPGWQWKIDTFNPVGYQLESPEDFTTRIRNWFKAHAKDRYIISFS